MSNFAANLIIDKSMSQEDAVYKNTNQVAVRLPSGRTPYTLLLTV